HLSTTPRPGPVPGRPCRPCPPLATVSAPPVMSPLVTCWEASTRAGSQRLPSAATPRPPTLTILVCLLTRTRPTSMPPHTSTATFTASLGGALWVRTIT